MTGVDCFVVATEIVVTNLSKFVPVQVGTEIIDGAVEPVLGIPVLWGTVDFFVRGSRAVDFLVPKFEARNYVERGEGEVKRILLGWFQYVGKFEQEVVILLE